MLARVTQTTDDKIAVLSKGEPRDAAVNFDTYPFNSRTPAEPACSETYSAPSGAPSVAGLKRGKRKGRKERERNGE